VWGIDVGGEAGTYQLDVGFVEGVGEGARGGHVDG
jgi:hypothetical protein